MPPTVDGTTMKDSAPTNDFVAYHSSDVMGHDYGEAGFNPFSFFSRKSRTFLERSIGNNVWVVTGKRNAERKMIYRLAAVYTPDEVMEHRDGCVIRGRRGHLFKSPFELNTLGWFKALFSEQNKFSFGFNGIRDRLVLTALHRLRTSAPGRKPKAAGMKALSIRQPWAWLIVEGYKDIENRSWPTRLRGRIWIHASAHRVTKAEYEDFLTICRERRIKKFPRCEDFQIGGIVGSAEIVGCVTSLRSCWFGGDYGFVLKDARRTRFKPMKGKLGFFDVRA